MFFELIFGGPTTYHVRPWDARVHKILKSPASWHGEHRRMHMTADIDMREQMLRTV